MTNFGTTLQRVAITVTSRSSGTVEPISAQAFWGDSAVDLSNETRKQIIYASVSQGTHRYHISSVCSFKLILMSFQLCRAYSKMHI